MAERALLFDTVIHCDYIASFMPFPWFTRKKPESTLAKQLAMVLGQVNALRARVDALEGGRKRDVPPTVLPPRSEPGSSAEPVRNLIDWKRGHWR